MKPATKGENAAAVDAQNWADYWRNPCTETSDADRLCKNPRASVFMITYNHEGFIQQAIEGVLMQETDFEYELVIGEDCSTDRTREICFEYQKKHPTKIRVLWSESNLWHIGGNHKRVDARCRGQYIALCEGDDYWTAPKKLQKQVEYMESHPGCVGCFHERGTGDAEAEGRPIPGAELSNEIRNGDREALGPTTSYVYVGFHPNSTGSCALTFLVLRPRVSAWGMGPFMLSTRGQTACCPSRFRLEGKGAVVAISFLKMWTSSLLACCPHAPGDGFSRSQRQARPCLSHRTNPVVDS